MKKIFISLGILTTLCDCTQQPVPSQQSDSSAAVSSLNEQIEEFNANRDANMGITPIERRVSRVEHDPKLDQVATFDQKGKPFLVLKRQPDGRFKGVLEQPFHQLAGSGPDGSHSWGQILAEFHLEKGMF